MKRKFDVDGIRHMAEVVSDLKFRLSCANALMQSSSKKLKAAKESLAAEILWDVDPETEIDRIERVAVISGKLYTSHFTPYSDGPPLPGQFYLHIDNDRQVVVVT